MTNIHSDLAAAKRPRRILIVDDERHNRQLLEVILSREGFVTLTATSGEEALATLARELPDLILLDIMMPGMDGYEVARTIKGNAAQRHIPIILITALDDRNARVLALSCGADDFLTKPFDRAELCTRVKSELAKREEPALAPRDALLEAEVERRKELERSFREREEELAEFFENAVEGLDQLAPDGTILWANRAETSLLGYARFEYIGHNIAEFHADAEVIADILTRLRAGETIHDHEARLRCKDGAIKHVLLQANVLRRDGQIVHARCFTRDITDRKRAEDALRAKKDELDAAVRQLNTILQQLPSAVIVVEAPSGKLVLSNEKSDVIFRQRAPASGDLTHNGGFVGLHGDGRMIESHEWPLSRSVRTGEVVTGEEAEILRGDGTRGCIRINSAPIRAEDGAIAFGVVTYEDVTEEVLAKRKVAAMLVELENASLVQDEFLATISHELRTPLNAILGWVRMLRSDTLPPDKQVRALEIIERNANAQTLLIEDLLDVSRIVSGKLRLDVGAVDLPGVVASAVDTVRPAADAKSVTIHQTIDPSAGPILGDAERLQQVVWNLLSNAVKFTPNNGAVQIAVRRRESFVDIIVADSGQGIGPAFLTKVFERFRQADAAPSRKHGGLGLGLAISRQLVELHGGTITVESEGLGKGSTFIVCLPISPLRGAVVRPPALRLDSPAAFHPRRQLEGVVVLVVDDEADARELLSEVLTSCGASVVTAGSVAEALRLVKERRPDVVVSDVGMPGEDGYVLIRQLRALPASEGGRTPAVALTAYARLEDRTKALMAGFNMHVPKPVEPAELLVVLSSLTTLIGRAAD
ncbi:ATP-binding protein [soil metagenome]